MSDYEIQLANPGLERTLEIHRGFVLADATPIADVHGPIDTLVIAGGLAQKVAARIRFHRLDRESRNAVTSRRRQPS